MAIRKNNALAVLCAVVSLGLVIVILLFVHKPPPVEVPAFLPGIYACEAGNEFCRIEDTVIIHRVS
ncbi:MAG TPA: hypothetical protein VGM89_03670, partial [Puia sp.]